MSKLTFQQRATELRERFIATLPERIGSARSLLEQLMGEARGDMALLHQLRTLFHNLKGTSSTYGFNQLAEPARQGEQLLDEALDTPIDRDSCHRLHDQLSAVIRALEGASTRGRHPGGEAGFDLTTCCVNQGHPLIRNNIVYLCDDDPDQRNQIVEQLACFGYQVRGFDDPEQLAAAVIAAPPDIIIMDIVFPGGEDQGLQAIARLQQRLERPLPTIFISGRDDFDARLKAVRAGGVAYCSKPVPPIDLVDILDSLCDRAEPEPYRILVVDDDPELISYIDMVLQEAGMSVRIVTQPQQVLNELPQFNADLVLMDLYMNECIGTELARILRQIPGYIGLPIVYLSGETDRERQLRAMSVGADGFITKPIRPDQLVSMVTLRAERMRTLRNLMVRDSLTGLFNHSNCKQMLDQEFNQATRRNAPLTLAMIDLDHFKQINDDFGHAVGDQVIIGLSRLLRQRLRKSDIIGRYGGEEFIVILPDTPLEDASRIMRELCGGFATILFYAAGNEFHVTFSCGIADRTGMESPSQMRGAADIALYQAKSLGRNRCQLAADPGAANE